MPKKIPDETKQLMEELYAENLSVAEIARRTDVSYSTAYGYTKAKQRGFASRTEYKEHLAKQKGFASRTEYEEHLVKQRGFASRTEYEEHLVKQRGFASDYDYREHLAKQRQQQPVNQELSHLIKDQLTKLGISQKRLAIELGITEGAISRYASGRTTPRKDLQPKLFEVLKLPYQTIDDLLEDIDIK